MVTSKISIRRGTNQIVLCNIWYTETFRSRGITDRMKETLRNHGDGIASVIFAKPYDRVLDEYKAIWKWIVLQVLPIVNFEWKMRVNAGAQGKAGSKNFEDIITSSDMAFVYLMIEW